MRAFESGNQYFEEKKYPEAIVEYRNAVRADPRFGEARQKLADAYGFTGNARAAFAEQIRAADLLPDDLNAQLKASAYLLLARQFEDAKTRVQRVLVRDPRNTQGLLILGHALAGLRDLDGAIAQIEQAIAIDPTNAGSYASLAGFKLADGERDQARAAYEKAVEVDPKSVPARLALANFQWGIGDPSGAEATFKAALALDPKHALANRALASYYMGTGRAKDAEPHLRTIAEAGGDPESSRSPTITWVRIARPMRSVSLIRWFAARAALLRPGQSCGLRRSCIQRSAPLRQMPLSMGCSRVSRKTLRRS